MDERVGGLVKRAGSLTETIASSLGVPLGCSEHLATASTSLFPVTRSILVNFAGTFKKYQTGAWGAVTADTNTSFGNLRPTTFGQIGSNLFIAGGRPAKWGGASGTIERVGIPAPTTAITTATSGTGITAVSGWQYMWTYYNSTSGLESDWSPLSTSTGAISDKQLDLTVPTTAASALGVDQKRIYRTLDGGATPYLLTTIAIATGTYADTTADASLTTPAAAYGDNDIPPATSYICAAFNGRMWYVDASNPYKLRYSQAYIGSDNTLEYCPTDNFKIFDDPITACLVLPGRLLVFHPRAISSVTGFSELDFQFQVQLRGTGTLFSTSPATNGSDVIFMAESGWAELKNGQVTHISREIDDTLQPIINNQYNAALYCSACWSPNLRQFLCSISAISLAGSPWANTATSAIEQWWDSSTHNIVEWQNSAAPGSETTSRVRFWGYSPELSDERSRVWMPYKFPQVGDLNAVSAYSTFLFTPSQSSDTLEPQQDKTYFGYFNGTDGHVFSAFRRDMSLDDSTNIDAKAISGRINPGSEGRYKRMRKIEFTSDYTDPTANGVTLQYIPDLEDPHLRDYTSYLTDFNGAGDVKQFTDSKLKHLHLYLRDNTANSGNIMLQDFILHYRELSQREGR